MSRQNTKKYMITELANRGLTKREAFTELRPLVESQIRPMVYSANVDGHREPKSMSEQLIELKNDIGRIYSALGRSINSDFDSEEIELPTPSETPEIPSVEIETEEEEPEAEESRPVRASGKERIKNAKLEFLRRVREIRAFCQERERLSERVDSISMRPVQAAAKLIPAGIPVDALLDAMTLHWSDDTRRDAGIRSFDFAALSRSIMRERGITEIIRKDGSREIPHFLFGYALVLAENRQPIMLVGPAGTGKSHLAVQLADYLELPYGETPMSPGATRGDLLGRHTIGGMDRAIAAAALSRTEILESLADGEGSNGGFIAAEFAECYGRGGLFNFEEIDAADAGMLIVLNNALASNRLYNSANGEMIDKSENFIAFSTANTFGLGANREFIRERLDAATIDRWRMGRIIVPLDENVEESILGV